MIMNSDRETKKVVRGYLGCITLFFILLVLGFLTFRPIINPREEDCTRIVGTLIGYKYSKHLDIHIKISENDNMYYLNRIDEPENIFSALDTLIGKKIVLYPVNHWSLLNPRRKTNHVARVTDEDENMIIYTEY